MKEREIKQPFQMGYPIFTSKFPSLIVSKMKKPYSHHPIPQKNPQRESRDKVQQQEPVGREKRIYGISSPHSSQFIGRRPSLLALLGIE